MIFVKRLYSITADGGTYIRMQSSVISKNAANESGITIGKNDVIGACSLVNKNIPDGATAVGVPCKIIVSEL